MSLTLGSMLAAVMPLTTAAPPAIVDPATLFTTSLVHYWDSYDSGTEIWTDSAGAANAIPQSTAPAAGVVNGRTYPIFDGVNTGMQVASFTTLDGAEDWCVFGSLKTNNGQAYGGVIVKASSFYFELNFGSGSFYVEDGAGTGSMVGTTRIDNNDWHRFICTVTNNEAILYIDAALNATVTFQALPTNGNPLLLGVQPNSTVCDCSIALIGMLDRGATPEEVVTLDAFLQDATAA